jgi:hypothetical protein
VALLSKKSTLPTKIQSSEESSRGKFKNIGIIFIEEIPNGKFYTRKRSIRLDFDQVACAHLLLQMNPEQNLFNFQIISPGVGKLEDLKLWLPTKEEVIKDGDSMIKWFAQEVRRIEALGNWDIDYWIGITSERILVF